MDKYEYKVRLGEIDTLILENDFEEAAIIADSIDWKRVKSTKTLCKISDVYKYVNRLEDAQELLNLAYERHPSSKSVVFALCELCIKLDQYVQALEYYKEYVLLAPEDYGRYVLQYKLYVAQDVSLEERIEVLQQLKKNTPIPKWQYELAYLYHRIGDSAKCIEECDELILWYGEGKYVTKAMELKMQHSPLTPTQQAKYDTKDITGSLYPVEEKPYTTVIPNEDAIEEPIAEPDHVDNLQVKTDVGEYNTINLQKELANSMKDMWEVTPDNLIRPVSTSLHPGDVKSVHDAGSDAYTEVKTEAESFDGAGFVEDDPMATKVLKEIREENNTQNLEEIVVEDKAPATDDEKFNQFWGMEYDGQMSLVVPEASDDDDKQITGQLRLEDILAEWEEKKKENERALEEQVRQRVLEHTGNILIDFDVSARDGLLEKLEKEPIDENATYEDIPYDDENYEDYEGAEETAEYEGEEEYTDEEYAEDEYAEEMTFEDELEEGEEAAVEEETEEAAEEITEEAEGESEALEDTEAVEETEEADAESEETEEEVAEAVPEENEEAAADAEAEEDEEKEEAVAETETKEEEKASKDEEKEEKEKAANAEVAAAEAAAEAEDNSQTPRELTKEEKELYASYIQNKRIQTQLVNAVDSVSLAPYAGNIIITGEEGMDPTTLAKNIMKEIQLIDSNFSGKIAKISGTSLNAREPVDIIGKISNGALIIENAGRMSAETAEKLYKSLQNEDAGIIVVMEGGKKSIGKLMEGYPKLQECFAAQIDLEALDNDTLVRFGKEYALSQEYSIDEMGLLALHTRISDHQTSDHAVTMIEVKKMITDAIRNANRKSAGHFFDVLFGKRYDEEDMIILKEKDFA